MPGTDLVTEVVSVVVLGVKVVLVKSSLCDILRADSPVKNSPTLALLSGTINSEAPSILDISSLIKCPNEVLSTLIQPNE